MTKMDMLAPRTILERRDSIQSNVEDSPTIPQNAFAADYRPQPRTSQPPSPGFDAGTTILQSYTLSSAFETLDERKDSAGVGKEDSAPEIAAVIVAKSALAMGQPVPGSNIDAELKPLSNRKLVWLFGTQRDTGLTVQSETAHSASVAPVVFAYNYTYQVHLADSEAPPPPSPSFEQRIMSFDSSAPPEFALDFQLEMSRDQGLRAIPSRASTTASSVSEAISEKDPPLPTSATLFLPDAVSVAVPLAEATSGEAEGTSRLLSFRRRGSAVLEKSAVIPAASPHLALPITPPTLPHSKLPTTARSPPSASLSPSLGSAFSRLGAGAGKKDKDERRGSALLSFVGFSKKRGAVPPTLLPAVALQSTTNSPSVVVSARPDNLPAPVRNPGGKAAAFLGMGVGAAVDLLSSSDKRLGKNKDGASEESEKLPMFPCVRKDLMSSQM